jgi:hypothetical protein
MCATCGCGKKGPMKKKKSDEKQDAKAMAGMSSKQKATFSKADAKMDKKPMSRKEDEKKDKALAKKIKKK